MSNLWKKTLTKTNKTPAGTDWSFRVSSTEFFVDLFSSHFTVITGKFIKFVEILNFPTWFIHHWLVSWYLPIVFAYNFCSFFLYHPFDLSSTFFEFCPFYDPCNDIFSIHPPSPKYSTKISKLHHKKASQLSHSKKPRKRDVNK